MRPRRSGISPQTDRRECSWHASARKHFEPPYLSLRRNPSQKRRRKVSTGCSVNDTNEEVPPSLLNAEAMLDRLTVGVRRDVLACEFVYVNPNRNTVHKVVAHGCVWTTTQCPYIPPRGAKPERLQSLAGEDMYTYEMCCGTRGRLILG